MRNEIFYFLLLAVFTLAPASGQEVNSPVQVQAVAENDSSAEQDTSMPGMRMQMEDLTPSYLPSFHDGSGTAWQPASVHGPMWMGMRGGWELMAHGVIFVDYNQQGGPRGEGKAESVNVAMLMEQHRLGRGTILFREMFSAESLNSTLPGFPELFHTVDS